MADYLNPQDLANAKVDAKTLGEAVNDNKIIKPRYGDSYKSIPMLLADGDSAISELKKIIDTAIGGAGWDASRVHYNGSNQAEFNKKVITNGAALPWMSNVEYALHAPVTKSDGTLVQSTVAGNKTNPNVNMTGWKVPSLKTADNLSDVPNKAAARSNLSVYSQTEVDTAISNATPTIPNATTTNKGIVRLNNTLTSTSTTEALSANMGRELRISLENAVIGGGGVSKEYVDTELSKKLGVDESVTSSLHLQNPMMLLGERVDVGGSIGEFNGSNSGFVPKPTASDTNKVLSSSGAWVAQSGDGTIPNATETVAGKAKIATAAIAQAGVNDTDFLTPKKLRDALNATGGAPIFACRAWGCVSTKNGTIYGHGNIQSFSVTATGVATVVFKTPMPHSNYAILLGDAQSPVAVARAVVKATNAEGLPDNKTTSGFILATGAIHGYYGMDNVYFSVVC